MRYYNFIITYNLIFCKLHENLNMNKMTLILCFQSIHIRILRITLITSKIQMNRSIRSTKNIKRQKEKVELHQIVRTEQKSTLW